MQKRAVIYPKDLVILTERSPNWCREKIKEIKKKYGLERSELVTLAQVCEHMKWDVKEVEKLLFR